MNALSLTRRFAIIGTCLLLAPLAAQALQPRAPITELDHLAFFEPELVIPSSNLPLPEALPRLATRDAWIGFFARNGSDFYVHIDPRSGVPSKVSGHIPLIPGAGVGNDVSLGDLKRRLGRPVPAVDERVVTTLVRDFIQANAAAFGIDPTHLGTFRTTRVASFLWQVSVPQVVDGIPVRHAHLAATINHGNLILLGTEAWGSVDVDTTPHLAASEAIRLGFAHVGGRRPQDTVWMRPQLEIVPIDTPQLADAIGGGYGHRLVWAFGFRRGTEIPRWEVLVDAHSGKVLSLQDKNHYSTERIAGGVYPLTSTEICPNNEQCGEMQLDTPMPFADTGLPAPNDVTNSAGLFEYTSGTATTNLDGPYLRIQDSCGAVGESATGSIQLGGTNGDHDCNSAGSSAGDTSASRSAFYELNKLIEAARGWLPTNSWLQNRLNAQVNVTSTCNAFWDNGTNSVIFFRSGGGCRNTGEIAAVFDHEWGHGMDDNDANGFLSNSSEGYADIAAIYRLHASCVGHGFWWTINNGCGMTIDGTGYNAEEAQQGPSHCATDCSGVRDSDWANHADNTPDTPQNFVCGSCYSSSGPCGRQVHCAAAPQRQAAWDLVARDLPGAPFGYDENTSFILGNKLFLQGSGNIGTWYSCSCGAGTSDGCGATSGYMQWLAADDDNGNLNDGTPHMTAIHAAFDRHNIACSTPPPTNSGCASGPSTAPTLTVSPANNQADLSWTTVPGATRYWVFRTEGFAGCDFGKVLIGETTGTSFSDPEVGNGREYCYVVMGVGASDACLGPASNCACVTPPPRPPITLAPPTLPNGTIGTAYNQTITASGGTAPYTFATVAGALPPGLSLSSGGTLSGSPTTAGTYPFTVAATDATGCVGTQGYTIVIDACPVITLSPATLPEGWEGIAYSVTITPSGGTSPYTLAVTAGSLPPGLSGFISGTPTTAGTWSFEITATDANGCAGSSSYDLIIHPAWDHVVGEGLDAGSGNRVRVFTRDGTATSVDFQAYGAGAWGTNVASGSLEGATYAEMITGPGPGAVYGPHVRGWDRTGSPKGKINYYAYGTLKYGVNVAAGDIDGDGYHEILSGAGPGAVFGPHVRGWNYDATVLGPVSKVNFFAYQTLKYGVNVDEGDLDADSFAELLTAPGPGAIFGPQIRGWNFDGSGLSAMSKINFNAFSLSGYGAYVSGGDVDGDGFAEIAATPGRGPSHPTLFRGYDFDGAAVSGLPGFNITPWTSLYGGRVGLGPLTGDATWELIAAPGPDPTSTSEIRTFEYAAGALNLLGSFQPYSGISASPGAGPLGYY